MFSAYYRFFGIDQLNEQAKKFVFKSLNIILLFIFVIMLTNTFFILYALEYVSPAELGIIIAVRFLVQGLTDYPTGAIGDWIGQRWVLFFAALFYCTGFITLSQATTFPTLLFAFLILALADGQQSGAFQAWMDNNYKIYAPEDNERRIYTEMFGKFMMANQILMALAFIIGGFLVTLYGRAEVFIIQGVLLGLMAFLFVYFIRDHHSIKRQKPNMKAYFSLLGEGITTSFNNRTLRLIIAGICISSAFMAIWGQLMLFPFYESYGKTDDMTGLLRSIIFIIGAIITGLMAIPAKKLRNPQKWLGITTAISGTGFLWGIYLIRVFNPPPETFNIISYVFVIVGFALIGILFSLSNVLMPRFYLEIIPDKNRNSVYSLMPTLIMFSSVIIIAFGGFILDILGFNNTLLVLGLFNLVGGLIASRGILTHRSKAIPIGIAEILESPAKKDLFEAAETLHLIDQIKQSDLQAAAPLAVPSSWQLGQQAR
ncbi:MAG: MFS transporter, partial [Candidatus Odinarchaeota archaeon]